MASEQTEPDVAALFGIPGHTRRAYWYCEGGAACVDDCFAGYVCDECTDASEDASGYRTPVDWPCEAAS